MSTHTDTWAGHAARSKSIDPQNTGTTTIAKQFTGMGAGGGESILRQMTGGGTSRSPSPTKPTSLSSGAKYARPKSVIGMRGEGRGMRLIQQMTGGRGGDY